MKAPARLVLLADTMLALYRQMIRIRRVEELLVRAYQEGLVPGDCHCSIGQEAIAAGALHHLKPGDSLFTYHRGHGHALAAGVSPEALLAELFGRATGCCGGRAGGRNLMAPEQRILGSGGVLGASVVEGLGAALACQLSESSSIAFAFFGEGALTSGPVHEGLQLASTWNLPLVLICENNQYSDQSRTDQISIQARAAPRSRAYHIHCKEVDGNDVVEVYEAAHEAVRSARAGDGPTLIECHTYRMRSHVEGIEEQPERPAKEKSHWQEKDPIRRAQRKLLEDRHATAEELREVQAAVHDEIRDALHQARNGPWPEVAS